MAESGVSTLSTWGSYPTWWVKAGVLPHLDARAGSVGRHISALKLYLAIALQVDFKTRRATLTVDELIELTNLSRPMIRPGLHVLENLGVIETVRRYRHEYAQVAIPGDQRWMKIPHEKGRIALRALPNRGASVLAALKIYLVLLHVRNSIGPFATISHETMQKLTGVRPDKVKSGIDHLVAHALLHVVQDDERSQPGRPVYIYKLLGLFDRRGYEAPTESNGAEIAPVSNAEGAHTDSPF